MYQHLFFDLDHTLWDFETNSKLTLKAVYDQHGLYEKGITDFEAFAHIYHMHNDKMWDRFRKGYITRDILRWKRFWLALLDYKIPSEQLANAMSDTYLELLPTQKALMEGAIEVLDYCTHKGYELHIITNGFEKTQLQKMENCGIQNYFKQIITSEAAMALKPKKEIYEYAQKMTGANASNSLMIGDTPEADILGAINAGWHSVYFNPLNNKSTIIATHEINTLKELIPILN